MEKEKKLKELDILKIFKDVSETAILIRLTNILTLIGFSNGILSFILIEVITLFLQIYFIKIIRKIHFKDEDINILSYKEKVNKLPLYMMLTYITLSFIGYFEYFVYSIISNIIKVKLDFDIRKINH